MSLGRVGLTRGLDNAENSLVITGEHRPTEGDRLLHIGIDVRIRHLTILIRNLRLLFRADHIGERCPEVCVGHSPQRDLKLTMEIFPCVKLKTDLRDRNRGLLTTLMVVIVAALLRHHSPIP